MEQQPLKTNGEKRELAITGYLYILREREFINTNRNIFKVGRTANLRNGLSNYPKNSEIIGICACKNVKEAECRLKRIFKMMYIQRMEQVRNYY